MNKIILAFALGLFSVATVQAGNLRSALTDIASTLVKESKVSRPRLVVARFPGLDGRV